MKAQITILNGMAGREIEQSLERHRTWGLKWVDLKDALWGVGILDLSDHQLDHLAGMLEEKGLGTWCLSTSLFGGDLDQGKAGFDKDATAGVDRALEVARRLKPRFIRFLGARSSSFRDGGCPGRDVWKSRARWLPDLIARSAVCIQEAGFQATIENESLGCVLHTVEDIESLFEDVGADIPLGLTWDIQNLWQCGVFPSLEVYQRLRPRLQYVHLKGGRSEEPGGPLKWKAPLERASWPVKEIVQAVIRDGVSPVICLNPSHGEKPPEGEPADDPDRDIAFLRRAFQGHIS